MKTTWRFLFLLVIVFASGGVWAGGNASGSSYTIGCPTSSVEVWTAQSDGYTGQVGLSPGTTAATWAAMIAAANAISGPAVCNGTPWTAQNDSVYQNGASNANGSITWSGPSPFSCGTIGQAVYGMCTACPSGESNVNGVCACPSGQTYTNGACACPAGQTQVNGVCTCPSGQSLVNGQCTCPPPTTLVNGSCASCPIQAGATMGFMTVAEVSAGTTTGCVNGCVADAALSWSAAVKGQPMTSASEWVSTGQACNSAAAATSGNSMTLANVYTVTAGDHADYQIQGTTQSDTQVAAATNESLAMTASSVAQASGSPVPSPTSGTQYTITANAGDGRTVTDTLNMAPTTSSTSTVTSSSSSTVTTTTVVNNNTTEVISMSGGPAGGNAPAVTAPTTTTTTVDNGNGTSTTTTTTKNADGSGTKTIATAGNGGGGGGGSNNTTTTCSGPGCTTTTAPSCTPTATVTCGTGDGTGDDNTETGGLDCTAPPTCTGDPTACYEAKMEWTIACEAQTPSAAQAEAQFEAGAGTVSGNPQGGMLPITNTVDASSWLSNINLSTGGCPQDISVSLPQMSISFSIPLSQVCTYVQLIRALVLIGALIAAFRIYMNGFGG